MPLGQKVKVCGRRFRLIRNKAGALDEVEGLKHYWLDESRQSDAWSVSSTAEEIWCGYYSDHSTYVFLCESCAVENGLKW